MSRQNFSSSPGQGAFMMSLSTNGFLISIEGPDGAGKSTQARMLLEKIESLGLEALLTREPGGTPIGEEVRKILLNPLFHEMTACCEVLLYCAARSQLVSQIIRPSLEKGIVVISDRFMDSNIVYQGYAGGEDLEMIQKLNLWATDKIVPDKTFLLDLPAEKGLKRLQGAEMDRVEQKTWEFHRRVRDGFLELLRRNPERISRIDAEKSPEEVHQLIWKEVKNLLWKRKILPRKERGAEHGV